MRDGILDISESQVLTFCLCIAGTFGTNNKPCFNRFFLHASYIGVVAASGELPCVGYSGNSPDTREPRYRRGWRLRRERSFWIR